jgi:hypothetical protein
MALDWCGDHKLGDNPTKTAYNLMNAMNPVALPGGQVLREGK